MIEFREYAREPFDFCASSGALGFDGLGWPWEKPLRWAGVIDPRAFVVVAKTVTAAPRAGNLRMWRPWTCVRTLPGLGTTNAVGLTNPGIDRWLSEDVPRARAAGVRLAASIKPETSEEACAMARLLRPYVFPFVEVNLSCPNVARVHFRQGEMLRALRRSGSPIVLKLSLDQVNASFIAAVDLFVDAYHAINTVPWDRVHPGKVSPIEGYGHGLKGGVSGPIINNHARCAVAALRGMTARPIVGGGGIFTVDDVLDFKAAGAAAFSIGTCFLHRPWRPNRIVRAYRAAALIPSPPPPSGSPPHLVPRKPG